MSLTGRLEQEIRAAGGSIPFSDFMRVALYDPSDGYYVRRQPFGKRGDFMTAPRVHDSFGYTIGRVVRSVWERLDQPSEFTILELGPGEDPLSLTALRSPALRDVPKSAWKLYLCERGARRVSEGGTPPIYATEWVEPGADLPKFSGVVLANEVLDAYPFRRLRREHDEWTELRVGAGNEPGSFAWVESPFSAAHYQDLLPAASLPEGTIVEVPEEVPGLLRWIASRLRAGTSYFFDYGDTEEKLARRFPQGSLSTFQSHELGDDPLDQPGKKDISAWVDFTRVERWANSVGLRSEGLLTQAEFLHSHGLEEVVRDLEKADAVEGVRARLALKTFFFGYEDHRVLTLRPA